MTRTGGVAGLLTQEARPGRTVTYTFMPHAGYARVLQRHPGRPADRDGPVRRDHRAAEDGADPPATAGLRAGISPAKLLLCTVGGTVELATRDFRLAAAAYDHPETCYDREYLFQFSEMDPSIHTQACASHARGRLPVHAARRLHRRSHHRALPSGVLPDQRPLDAGLTWIPIMRPQYPHQPYNGNPHMHPGEQVLLRIIGQGRWQHPFHEHANHVRVLARDGN